MAKMSRRPGDSAVNFDWLRDDPGSAHESPSPAAPDADVPAADIPTADIPDADVSEDAPIPPAAPANEAHAADQTVAADQVREELAGVEPAGESPPEEGNRAVTDSATGSGTDSGEVEGHGSSIFSSMPAETPWVSTDAFTLEERSPVPPDGEPALSETPRSDLSSEVTEMFAPHDAGLPAGGGGPSLPPEFPLDDATTIEPLPAGLLETPRPPASESAAFPDPGETVSFVESASAGALAVASREVPTTPAATSRTARGSTNDSGAPRRSLLLVLLASYASAVTIALLYVLATSRARALESLPDVAPLKEGEVRYYQFDAPLPPGHVLPLEGRERFGHIVVEPLAVTRGSLQYVHYTGDPERTREGTGPVLKLRLRLTNVSQDQTIVPLDAPLVFRRDYKGGRTMRNVFVRPSDSTSGEQAISMFEHPLSSEWDFTDQNIGRALAPGESCEVFLPTTSENIDRLSGELVWRFHLRKGFSPRGHGVTTLVEVVFPAEAIEDDPATPA